MKTNLGVTIALAMASVLLVAGCKSGNGSSADGGPGGSSGTGGSSGAALSDTLGFAGQVNPIPGFNYSTGPVPSSGPVQIDLSLSESGVVAVTASALASGSGPTVTGIPGSGTLGINLSFALGGTLTADIPGLGSYDGGIPGLSGINIAIVGDAGFDPFLIGGKVPLTVLIPQTNLPPVPLSTIGLPGADLDITVEGTSTLTTQFSGICAAVTSGPNANAHYTGELTTTGTLQLLPSVVATIPLLGSKSYGPATPIPVAIGPYVVSFDLGTDPAPTGGPAPTSGTSVAESGTCMAIPDGGLVTAADAGGGSSSGSSAGTSASGAAGTTSEGSSGSAGSPSGAASSSTGSSSGASSGGSGSTADSTTTTSSGGSSSTVGSDAGCGMAGSGICTSDANSCCSQVCDLSINDGTCAAPGNWTATLDGVAMTPSMADVQTTSADGGWLATLFMAGPQCGGLECSLTINLSAIGAGCASAGGAGNSVSLDLDNGSNLLFTDDATATCGLTIISIPETCSGGSCPGAATACQAGLCDMVATFAGAVSNDVDGGEGSDGGPLSHQVMFTFDLPAP